MKRLVLAFALLALAGSAVAQYPERPIRLIVPQAAGSATDNVARTLAPERSASTPWRRDSAKWADVVRRSGAKID